jgi:hypothetical protein
MKTKRVSIVIAIATAYAAFYNLTPFIGVSDHVIIGLYLFSPFLVVRMAYVIVRYGEPSRHTFTERFYDDLDYWRNGHHIGREERDSADQARHDEFS